MQGGAALTALRFDGSGVGCAVGTEGGLVALFDLRARAPLLVKDHMYGQPITDIKFHQPGGGAPSGGRIAYVPAARTPSIRPRCTI